MAFLAALPKAPSRYNPERNYDMAFERRNWVLERMFVNGYIDKYELNSLKKIPINTYLKENNRVFANDYYLEEILDEDQQEELHEYFLEAETDKIEAALEEFDGDYDDEELRLFRIKFISEVAN